MTPHTVLPILEAVDQAFARGPAVPCRRGCSACCHGPFDISPADAMLVADGVKHLGADARAAVERRAATQLMAYRVILPAWHAPHDVDVLPEVVFDHLVDLLRDAPCPALDADGSCVIHAHRPATCRLMGRSWIDDASGDALENNCPIQDRFPGYAEQPPTTFALAEAERALGALDDIAVAAGHVSTTVAGAITSPRASSHPPAA